MKKTDSPKNNFIKRELEVIRNTKGMDEWALWILNAILILLQIFILVFFSYDRPNAFVDIKEAIYVYETGKIASFSPMMIIWGYMARILHIHPLTIIFSFAPVIMLPIYYRIYTLLGRSIFEDDRKKSLLFVFFISVMQIFGYQSGYADRITLLFGYFSTQCVIVHGVLPFVLYVLVKNKLCFVKESLQNIDQTNSGSLMNETDYKANDDSYDDWEEEDMKKHPIVNSRNIGIALVLCMLMVLTAIFILNRKINSLHDATQNLQIAMEEKCSLYEFVPEAGGEVEGYVMKLTDGRLVVIDGGSKDNGALLYDFIAQYGNVIDTWYLNDKEESSAYEYCREKTDLDIMKVQKISVGEE